MVFINWVDEGGSQDVTLKLHFLASKTWQLDKQFILHLLPRSDMLIKESIVEYNRV
jgi:hypothetical protein